VVPVAWIERAFPEGSRLRVWFLSWRETSEVVAAELARGPLGTRTPGETEEPDP